MSALKGSLDRQEQQSRRNCFVIYGLPEPRNENMDELVINAIKRSSQNIFLCQNLKFYFFTFICLGEFMIQNS